MKEVNQSIEKSFRKCHGELNLGLIAKYQRSAGNMLNDLFALLCIYAVEVLSVLIIYKICHIDCHFNTTVAVCDECHA